MRKAPDYGELHLFTCQSALDSELNSRAIPVYKLKQSLMKEPYYLEPCITYQDHLPCISINMYPCKAHHNTSRVIVGVELSPTSPIFLGFLHPNAGHPPLDSLTPVLVNFFTTLLDFLPFMSDFLAF